MTLPDPLHAENVLRALARKAGHLNPDGMSVAYLDGWLSALVEHYVRLEAAAKTGDDRA